MDEMAHDKGVHPGLITRAFKKLGIVVERETKLERLRRDIAELEVAQAKRPLKPPGRR